MVFDFLALLAFAVWLYLAFGRDGFWLGAERDDFDPPSPAQTPEVTAVIPARNEAEGVGACVESLLRQDYRGLRAVVLVDDESSDGTAMAARQAGAACGAADRLTIVAGTPPAPGWTGKLWAMRQGIAAATAGPPPDFLLLTDADIVYAPQVLGWLVAHASANRLVLASFMVELRCDSLPERGLIPAFIFFFQMLYPFAWVNRPAAATAAAAGGCMLVRADALQQAGGIDAIRSALIDDCALAAALKTQGPIWLGLTGRVRSLRRYPHWSDVGHMVSRTAYAQLRYSPPLLLATVAALAFVYLLPPVATIFGAGPGRAFGIGAWAIMAILFQPTLRSYRLSPLWGFALPAIAAAYLVFTVQSAIASMRGKGGLWKGRFQAAAGSK
ncbi:MAG TPA: glycosyltransferase [Xanthobacteraceae bacterium]|jgi:hopene-associated glycosyltransferase HpnB|nr:glycosyltransferase [Xanthobacteraceae bacterium]